MAVGLAILIGAGIPRSASAVPLPLTSITAAEFSSFADSAILPALVSIGDFAPFPTDDVKVVSQQFPGMGAAGGQNIYVYQINHLPTSDAFFGIIGAMRFEWGGGAPSAVDLSGIGSLGLVTTFYIDDDPLLGPLGSPFIPGTVAPSVVDYDAGTSALTIEFPTTGGGVLGKGDTSFVIGAFSPLPPGVFDAIVAGPAGIQFATAKTNAPTPEPSSLILFGVGLLSALMVVRRWNTRRV